jgi:translocation protein SEC63
MLQYDTSAFHFFLLSLLSFYLIPSWYAIITRLHKAFFGTKDKDIGAVARTSDEKKKVAQLKKTYKGFSALGRGFWINFLITLVITLLFFYLIVSVKTDGEVNSFDPFHILEVDSAADMKTIKKAYKKQSLKWHPDKNPNNPAAEAKFMMIAKAYEALTDPTAKENYEKYGNPDGKQSLEVSIGLPSWLLDTDNRNLVLMGYLIVMVGVIPFCVWRYYSNSSKFGEKDVMYDSYAWYHHTLNEHTLIKNLPETLAGSAEFRQRNMPASASEREEISSLMGKLRSQMLKPKYQHPVCVKGNVLLHAHLCRETEGLSPKLKEDLNYMLENSGSLVEAMISVCKHQESVKTAMNCITFGQNITQALWVKDNELLQLPHFTNEEVKYATTAKKAVKGLAEYITVPDEEKKGITNFTDDQKNDVLKCCKIIPDLSVETKIFVDDDEDNKVYAGDLCTVRVTLTRKNLEEGEKAGFVHAPHFPFPRREAWWVAMATKDGKIISIEKITNPARVVEHDIKFLAPSQGTYEFVLHVMSNAYIGLDQKQNVELVTLDDSTLPEYKVHPDDAELDDEPTLFEEMLNANVEQDSDSDDDDDSDDDEKEEAIKELSAAEKKKLELQKRRKAAAGDDSDDDSSVEEVYAD